MSAGNNRTAFIKQMHAFWPKIELTEKYMFADKIFVPEFFHEEEERFGFRTGL